MRYFGMFLCVIAGYAIADKQYMIGAVAFAAGVGLQLGALKY